MHLRRLALFVLGSAALALSLRADTTEDTINADMHRLGVALKAKDLLLPIEMMYTPVVQAEGGRDALVKSAHDARATIERKSIMIQVFEPLPPYQRVSTPVNDYVIIPLHVRTQIGIHHVDSSSFQLAIRPHGATKWEYLNGASISPAFKNRFFPDLKDTSLPRINNKPID